MSDPTLIGGLRDAAAAAGGTAAVGSVLFWLFKRWVDKIDRRFDALAQKVDSLTLAQAVTQERQSGLLGGIEMVRRTTDDTAKSVGVLDRTVTKVWTVLQAKGIIGLQPSDEACKNGGS